jgi:hypothetical protein
MNTIQVFAYRGLGTINNCVIVIDGKPFPLSILSQKQGMFNVRCIIELVSDELSYPDELLGKKINEFTINEHPITRGSRVSLVNEGNFDVEIALPFESAKYGIGCKIYEDYPVHQYGVLETIPVPTNLLTLYFFFYKEEIKTTRALSIEKYFDGYSHLGFFLTDLPRMKELIFREYGNRKLDLVNEFSNTELIEMLLKEGIIMIVWGINPYTYPIYSSNELDLLLPLVGEAHKTEGIFNIDEDIKELSLIPGHKLTEWPDFTDEQWPLIKLYGSGRRTYLKPFVLKDSDSEAVVTSFVIYRSEGYLEEARPIVNVDLLYDV